MAFTDLAEFNVPRHIVQKGALNVETITTNKTLVYSNGTYQVLTNATGVLDCILPAVKDGAKFWIKNVASSTHNIVVKDADGGTISTLSAGNGALVVSSASAWHEVIKG